ncbi:MAG: helix-turn-helix domain-containing protein [Coriobacteriales bacterium]|jgi:transcriptional regulator with XRE-family HTH domain|nr:helix-turn-helix domain-containing protein [Coriobacteriales bacterium]
MEPHKLHELGINIRTWRKLQGITATKLAMRAGISRTTLANIENGSGTTSLANFFAVLEALGIAAHLVQASYPAQTELGRELIYRKTRNEK